MQSMPRRSRRGQGDGERVAGENHEGYQPSDYPLGVRIGADQLSDVADGRGLGLDLPALGSHAGAFRLEGGSTG